jgi:hypothetical protein
MTDPLSLDFDDGFQPANPVTLAASPTGRILYVGSTDSHERVRMPEIDDQRFRRRSGRGHHAARSAGEIVTIDADLRSHFGTAEAVNDALRRVVVDRKKAAGS